jgi:hypothetical protein
MKRLIDLIRDLFNARDGSKPAADPLPAAQDPTAEVAATDTPPPEPLTIAEQMRLAGPWPPGHGYVLIPAYFFWTGETHELIPSRWDAAPFPGAHWIADHWIQQKGRWVLKKGYWLRK